MKRLFQLSIAAILFSITAIANVYEHSEFASIFNYLNPNNYHKNTIVILDIDNTIATTHAPFQFLGSDAWYSYEFNKRIEAGLSVLEAKAEINPFFFPLVHIIELRPVEPTIPQIIKQLQERGITVIACTARSLEISDRTIVQLNNIGINFSLSGFGDQELWGTDTKYRYKDGIIFCHGIHKGPTLNIVLNHFNHVPTKVIFVDDRESYVRQVKDSLHPDIEFIGIRYSHMDDHVAQFDPVIAEQEKQAYIATL